MALPTAYLTSAKNLDAILIAIRSAQAPDKFTGGFLNSLEFKSSSDRLIVGVLKALRFIDDGGKPTQRYFEYLDQTQSPRVLADGIREAYGDLFRINIKAHELSKQEVVNKLKTLSQGQLGDSVLDKMAMTFTQLVKHADFSAAPPIKQEEKPETEDEVPDEDIKPQSALSLGGLVYNFQIVLPESRDPAVYDALFRSLRKHLP